MRRVHLSLTAALAAAAFTAAPAGAAQDPPPCDPGRCPVDVLIEKVEGLSAPTVDKVIWAVECTGYALGGNPCTGP
jgi:hypothetical protein